MVRSARAKQDARAGRAAADDLERARALQHSGDLARARVLCEGILSHDDQHAGAHCLLGALHGQGGDLDRAFTHLSTAARLAPQLEDAHLGLGNVHRLRGALDAAADSYRRALAIRPDASEAHFSLGLVLRQAGRVRDALEHFERASELAPASTDAVRQAALCHTLLGSHESAVALLERALRTTPAAGELHAALGFAYQKMHRSHAALECYDRARELGHEDAEYWNNRGTVMQELGRIPEAFAAYERALQLQPDFSIARFHRGLARLLTGDYANGWPDYELRLLSEELPFRNAAAPRWDGSTLAGRTLLVYGEQGLGDEIMFASCLPDVVAAAGRCVIECHPKLEGIFRRSFPAAAVCAATPKRVAPDPPVAGRTDWEVPSGSLPLYFRRSLSDFPRHAGYLRPDPERLAAWRRRLAALGPGLKVGMSWAGGTYRTRSPLRSIPLDQWLPIFETEGVRWVSLQYGEAAGMREAVAAQGCPPIEHWQDAIDDYEETAALVSALDMVISVQTAIVHLSGALGRPVWAMVSYCPEWRYGFAGENMPWYPSVRVFRQPSIGEWQPVISAVARELRALAQRTEANS